MQSIIFTDGASRGNPGSGGWGAVVVFSRSASTSFEIDDLAEVVELGGREENTTNNRMELMAVINGLAKVSVGSECVVYTDSSYLINGITKWVFAWQKNGWKTKTGGDVSNKDLWMELSGLNKDRKVSYKYVGGHVGIAGNERCDVIATSMADKKNIDMYSGPLSKYFIKDIKNVSQNLEKEENKKSIKARSNAKAYSYISMVSGKVETHPTWALCEKRVKGVKGARFKKALSKIEEEEIVKEFGGF